jgi:hypothetical protein
MQAFKVFVAAGLVPVEEATEPAGAGALLLVELDLLPHAAVTQTAARTVKASAPVRIRRKTIIPSISGFTPGFPN